jgi:transcriptional regulator with PAS, ATPase and Fis domain
MLKAVWQKKQIAYKVKSIKITTDFSIETLKSKREWSEVFQAQKENNFRPRICYPVKLSFKIDGRVKIFHDKQKLKQYDHQNTTTEDSERYPIHRRWKQT